jgi:hypothetical protein
LNETFLSNRILARKIPIPFLHRVSWYHDANEDSDHPSRTEPGTGTCLNDLIPTMSVSCSYCLHSLTNWALFLMYSFGHTEEFALIWSPRSSSSWLYGRVTQNCKTDEAISQRRENWSACRVVIFKIVVLLPPHSSSVNICLSIMLFGCCVIF